MIELLDKYTPEDISRLISKRAIDSKTGETMIKRYGDRRVMEALVEHQKMQGVHLNLEIEKTMERVLTTLDGLFENTVGCI